MNEVSELKETNKSKLAKARRGKEFEDELEIISRLKAADLMEYAYIVETHLHFQRVVWPSLEPKLKRETVPMEIYEYSVCIWNPQNYLKEK